jgi:hypothetical protein
MSFRTSTRVTRWRQSYVGKRMLAKYGHRVNAEASLKAEHFMSHRDMRIYWGDTRASLYHPCSRYSRYLSYFVHGGYHRYGSKRRLASAKILLLGWVDLNECVCKDKNGEPLNQCNECPR